MNKINIVIGQTKTIFGILFFLLFAPSYVLAYDVEIGGIYYNLDNRTNTAEVTNKDNVSQTYSGFINIPSSITVGSINYTVNSIGGSVFYDCADIKEVTIPRSVTIIGSSAFAGCSGLTSITIPESVTFLNGNPFWGCVNLSQIIVEDGNPIYDSRDNSNAIIKTSTNELITGCKTTIIPNSVTSIGSSAFDHCKGLKVIKIPNSVKSIGHYAFWNCDGLTSITIPNSVTSIINNPFTDCENITSINVELGNSVYDSRDNCNAIVKTSDNELILGCKSTIIPNSVKSISDGAFAGQTKLTSISIPGSVFSIGNYSFSGCEGLSSLTISNGIAIIGNNAFRNCI